MSDLCVEQIKETLIVSQSGSRIDDIRVMGSSRQFNQGFGDFICNICFTVTPVIMRVGKTLFKTSAESIKEGSSIGDSFKSALKHTLRTALKHDG